MIGHYPTGPPVKQATVQPILDTKSREITGQEKQTVACLEGSYEPVEFLV